MKYILLFKTNEDMVRFEKDMENRIRVYDKGKNILKVATFGILSDLIDFIEITDRYNIIKIQYPNKLGGEPSDWKVTFSS
jgi:hypothetical protein